MPSLYAQGSAALNPPHSHKRATVSGWDLQFSVDGG
jgi:hypothetical protein